MYDYVTTAFAASTAATTPKTSTMSPSTSVAKTAGHCRFIVIIVI